MDVVEIAKRTSSRKDDPPQKHSEEFYKEYFDGGKLPKHKTLEQLWEEKIEPIDRSKLPQLQYLNEIFDEELLRTRNRPVQTSINELIERYTPVDQLTKLNALLSKTRHTEPSSIQGHYMPLTTSNDD